MNQKLFLSAALGAVLSLGLSGVANAVPPGWKIDSIKNNPDYRKYAKQFKEVVVFRKNNGDDQKPSRILWGKFSRRTGMEYDEYDILNYYLGSMIPCYSKNSVKFDEDERYIIECDYRPPVQEGEDPLPARHYVGIYKNIEYLGYIILADGATYQDIANLGADPNALREKKPISSGGAKKKSSNMGPDYNQNK